MTKTTMIVHTESNGEVKISIPSDKTFTRSEIQKLVITQLLKEDPNEETFMERNVDNLLDEVYIDWKRNEVPSNVTYNSISKITQQEIDQLKSDVENEVDGGYDIVAGGMQEATEAFALEHGYDPEDVSGIVSITNFEVYGDEDQVVMTANNILSWKPEHRARLIQLLTV